MARESLLLFNVGNMQTAAIKRLADNMRLRVVEVSADKYDYTLGDICDGKAGITGLAAMSSDSGIPAIAGGGVQSAGAVSSGNAAIGKSLLVFAGVTDKHMDKVLFEMKSRQITVDYKAVMTETNRTWNIHRLMFEMEKERRAYLNK